MVNVAVRSPVTVQGKLVTIVSVVLDIDLRKQNSVKGSRRGHGRIILGRCKNSKFQCCSKSGRDKKVSIE